MVMDDNEILASWLEGYRERVLRGKRFEWKPGGEWKETLPDAIGDWEEGYAQALADVAEHVRLGQLGPGGELYESERRHLEEQEDSAPS